MYYGSPTSRALPIKDPWYDMALRVAVNIRSLLVAAFLGSQIVTNFNKAPAALWQRVVDRPHGHLGVERRVAIDCNMQALLIDMM